MHQQEAAEGNQQEASSTQFNNSMDAQILSCQSLAAGAFAFVYEQGDAKQASSGGDHQHIGNTQSVIN